MTEPTETAWLTAIPPKVATAIVAVMKGVEKLQKGERNPHANYKYAGVESFLEMVRPLCAEAGLIVMQDEESFEFREAPGKEGRPIVWLVMTFTFGFAHASGETWGVQLKRTAMVQASMGSQAFGAAQSYALKSVMRSVFQIATGETEDADSHPQDNLPVSATRKKESPTYGAEDSARYAQAMVDQIKELPTVADVADYAKQNASMYQRCLRKDQTLVSDALSKRKAALENQEGKVE